MDSGFIQSVLYKKHNQDFALHQLSTNKSYSFGTFVLDFWAMKLNWKLDDTYGYEIKISREDFLRDLKWPNYLDYCNRFYFVCPTGLIKPEEIEPKVGLIYVNQRGGFKVVKAAIYRNINIPISIYKNILLTRLTKFNKKSREEYIKDYVNDKISSQELGEKFNIKLIDEINKLKYISEYNNEKILKWKTIMDRYSPESAQYLIDLGRRQ